MQSSTVGSGHAGETWTVKEAPIKPCFERRGLQTARRMPLFRRGFSRGGLNQSFLDNCNIDVALNQFEDPVRRKKRMPGVEGSVTNPGS